MLPGQQVRRRVDGPVVPECEVGDRVHLEMEVVRRSLCIAGVTDEADHFPRPDAMPVPRRRRVGGEMRVVELVPLAVTEPEAVAAHVVPADREDRPVRAGKHRRPERGEDVVAVMPIPRHVTAEGAESIRKVVRPVHGEDVAAGRQRGL